MRLPAVAIAAAFAGGIAMGWPGLHVAASRSLLIGAFCAALLFLAVSFVLVTKSLLGAGLTSLLAWFALGVSAAAISQ